MKLGRKITICVAALAGVGFGATRVANAQNVCRHIGQWTLIDGRYVCTGHYASGQCVWTDDCRVNVE
jgi:hypothetical protein